MKIKQGYRLFSLIAIVFFIVHSAQARHIVGGNITYDCLGNDVYEFTLTIYRDCACTNCAPLDDVAAIGIYRCTNCSNQNQMTPFGVIQAGLGERGFVQTPDYPCLEEPDICVEQGTYVFRVTLPRSDQSYHISYQRCCRNITINNLVDPESLGATYSIELLPDAQAVCNDSPIFNSFPPTVICGDFPLEYDHSARDTDGDRLEYSFCPPLLGGGRIFMETPAQRRSCNGSRPDPGCPPPYRNVPFLPPAYSAEIPMAGRPTVQIDQFSGQITGTPTVQGQFVVGVCVEEWRDTILMSRVFRDFQFNVESCVSEVTAALQSDIQIDNQTYGVNSCGSTTVTFQNESFQERFIDSYLWEFDVRNELQTTTVENPTVAFPDVGTYEGRLIVNPGEFCEDTAFIVVNIFPDLEADFEYDYDTCIAGEVAFTNLSMAESGFITDYTWEFGDGRRSKVVDPLHQYRIPGALPVTLSIRDTNRCTDVVTKIIDYFPVPALIVISPSAETGCEPVDIFFDNLSFPIDDTYDIRWNFGDGGRSEEISPTHTYEDIGTFTVDLSIVSPIGCETDTIFPDLVTVLPSPTAGFSYSPDEPSVLSPEIQFFESARDVAAYNWDFGDGNGSAQPNPVHVYRDTGLYEVIQVVTHPNGCTDTVRQDVDIRPEVRYHLPNAFSPNNDGVNDEYFGVGIMAGAKDFIMTIWDRWGQQLFSTTDPNEGWNGRKFNTGSALPNGVYVVKVSYEGPRGDKFNLKGFATLLR